MTHCFYKTYGQIKFKYRQNQLVSSILASTDRFCNNSNSLSHFDSTLGSAYIVTQAEWNVLPAFRGIFKLLHEVHKGKSAQTFLDNTIYQTY